MPTFEHRSRIPATLAQVIAFHDDPRALRRLTPPPILLRIHRDSRTSLTDGEVDLTLWFGPLPVHWLARHQPGATEHAFHDSMVRGPMRSWEHEHTFRPVDGGVELLDRVVYEHRAPGFWSMFTRLFFGGLALRFLFIYRHWRTRRLAPTYPA
ncbi:MAG: SRPBCC family protein [Anaerolineae bacterium]